MIYMSLSGFLDFLHSLISVVVRSLDNMRITIPEIGLNMSMMTFLFIVPVFIAIVYLVLRLILLIFRSKG